LSKNVARGSLLGMLGQGWHLVTAFLLYAFLARALGPSVFGRWSVVLSLLAWFEVVVTSALVRVATKEISEAPQDAPRLARSAYVGQAVVAMAVFLAVIVGAGPIAQALSDPSLAPLIRIAALDIPLYGLFMIASSVVLGMQRYERQGVARIIYATAKAVFIAALVAAGFSITGALIGNALSSLVGVAALAVHPGARRERLAELWSVARTMMATSVPFLVLSLVEGVGQHADLWLVFALVPDRVSVGQYAAAAVLAEIPVFLFLGLNRVIFPSVVGARADGDAGRAGMYAKQAIRTALIVTVIAVAFVASAGRQAIEIVYSAAYLPAFVPLVLLMVAGLGRTIQTTGTEVLMAQGRRRVALGILSGTVVVQIASVAWLATRSGLVGAAAGAAASAIAAALLVALALRSQLGWAPVATLARSVAAASLVGTAVALLPVAPIALPVVFLVGGAAYLGLLRLFGEFSAADRASMRSALGIGPGPAIRRLVVNADDFGWSHSVNSGIVEAHTAGIVTRTSILATGAAFADAAALALATPTLAVGVHLNIYRGDTILPAERVSTLVGPDGRLLGSWQEIVRRLATGRFDLGQVEDELRAQIRHVIDAGLMPGHLDSEKHLHLWPGVFDVVCRLAVEFDIPIVRIVREPLSTHLIPLGLSLLSLRDRAVARRLGLITADATIGVTRAPVDARSLEAILGSTRGRNVEFCVHPGHVDDEFMALQNTVRNRLVCQREEEFAALTAPGARAAVERAGFVLAGSDVARTAQ